MCHCVCHLVLIIDQNYLDIFTKLFLEFFFRLKNNKNILFIFINLNIIASRFFEFLNKILKTVLIIYARSTISWFSQFRDSDFEL